MLRVNNKGTRYRFGDFIDDFENNTLNLVLLQWNLNKEPLGAIILACKNKYILITLSAFTCLKLTIEALEQGVKYVQS